MNTAFEIAEVRFVAGTPADQAGGLLGYVSFNLGPVRVDGVTVRRTVDGRYALSFPSRKARDGRLHCYVRPLGDRERRDLEHQVLAALGLAGGHKA